MVSLPPSVTYIPNFITPEEEKQLLDYIYSVPDIKWTNLSNRRLQNWGGLPHPKGMMKENIPYWLQTYFDKITCTGAFGNSKPNHCLVNEYKPGQGITPHEDGDLFYPTVSTITLGSHGVLDFYKHLSQSASEGAVHQDEPSSSLEDRHIGSVLLERCSLILVQEDLYKLYLHGIKEQTSDVINEYITNLSNTKYKVGDCLERGTRVSMTIRHVPRVISSAKLNNLFGRRR